MYARNLSYATHSRRFTVRIGFRTGWEIRDEFDAQVLKSALYTDWHRVERAKAMFALEVVELKDRGWIEL